MFGGLPAIDLVNLNLKKSTSFVGGSASPFIDKGDGFTGERERVRMFLSFVAHTHNTVDVTVECQVHMGGCVGFFRKGGCRYLQNTIVM